MTRAELLKVNGGWLISSKDFPDYSIKSGKRYRVLHQEWGYFICPSDDIRIDGEINDDLLVALEWIEK